MGLPHTLVEEQFLLVHGSPSEPLWDYLISYSQAVEAWTRTETSDVLVGHSHYQFSGEAGSVRTRKISDAEIASGRNPHNTSLRAIRSP